MTPIPTGQLPRRAFLRNAALLLGATTMLEACAPAAPAAPTAAPKSEAKPAAPAATSAPITKTSEAPKPAAEAKPAPVAKAGPDRELVVAVQSQFQTLDPHMHTVRDIHLVNRMFYDNVLGRDLQSLKVAPGVVTEWKTLDNLTWELKLRSGVTFHDGTPLTAGDIKFSAERTLNPEQKSPRRPDYTWIAGVEAPDPRTVRIRTAQPTPMALESLSGLTIVSEKYVRDKGDAFVAENPMGTGPYRFVGFDRAAGRVTMEVNRDFWGDPKPRISRITFRTIPEKATQLAELLSGGVHVVRNVTPDQIPVITSSGVADIRSKPILRVVFARMDSTGRGGDTPFTKLEVRQAVNHAVDRKAIVERILSGQGLLVEAPINPYHFGYDEKIKSPYDYNPDKAKQLLTQAGYPNGFEIELYFYEDIEVVEAITGYLSRIGVKASVKDFRGNTGSLSDLNRAGKVKDIYYQSWGSNSVFDADAILYTFFHSASPTSYNNTPEMDGWLTEARSTLDEAKRKELYSSTSSTRRTCSRSTPATRSRVSTRTWTTSRLRTSSCTSTWRRGRRRRPVSS